MSIPELGQVGQYLLGGKSVLEQPAWLQSLLSSVSPLGSFISLAGGARLVLLQAKFSAGNKQFVPVFQVRSHTAAQVVRLVVTEHVPGLRHHQGRRGVDLRPDGAGDVREVVLAPHCVWLQHRHCEDVL